MSALHHHILTATLFLGGLRGCGAELAAPEPRPNDISEQEGDRARSDVPVRSALIAPSREGEDEPLEATQPAATLTPAEVDPVCGSNMRLVAGKYCLTPEHHCLAHQDILSKGKIIPNMCLRYRAPVTCFDNRRKPMRFCMDRYEWPNQEGVLPRTLVSWQDARELCASVGKRLCTEEEFNFACEGEDMQPYVYGSTRDPSKCNIDRPYRPRTYIFTPFDSCISNNECRTAYETLDQRKPAGAMESCRSKAGIYDLNGNVNEWVMIPGATPPHRSGIKGGWWGPVRNRCRPTVTFHDEGDFGYEVGFRCCSEPPRDGPPSR